MGVSTEYIVLGMAALSVVALLAVSEATARDATLIVTGAIVVETDEGVYLSATLRAAGSKACVESIIVRVEGSEPLVLDGLDDTFVRLCIEPGEAVRYEAFQPTQAPPLIAGKPAVVEVVYRSEGGGAGSAAYPVEEVYRG